MTDISPNAKLFDDLEKQYHEDTDWTSAMNTREARFGTEPEPFRYEDSTAYAQVTMPGGPGQEVKREEGAYFEEKPPGNLNANVSAGPAPPMNIQVPGLETLPGILGAMGKAVTVTMAKLEQTTENFTKAIDAQTQQRDTQGNKATLVIGNGHAMMTAIEKSTFTNNWMKKLNELADKFDSFQNYLNGVMPKKGQGQEVYDELVEKVDKPYREHVKLKKEDRAEWMAALRIETPDKMKECEGALHQLQSITCKYWPPEWVKRADKFKRETGLDPRLHEEAARWHLE